MTLDALLAIAHHLAAFGVLATLAAEWALVRPGLDAVGVLTLSRIDAAYGALATTVIAVGIARVALGAAPASFYLESPTFWLKMGAFATVGLLSVAPTRRYVAWRKAATTGGDPAADEVTATGRRITLQLAIFALIPTFAALMARGIGT